ncbi:non-specific lipid transfer protein GPI-anchored 9-like [Trifolium pratense]|uniref:non-specific lipid transfer protein GPI-anchored 9-like n=1 Tax=Trifolium pratense TaxID=57577 RepID=UPI001E69782C|nr:non-specific lipid transfer protein GPI-anchored 9-like [Trifolium pratense]
MDNCKIMIIWVLMMVVISNMNLISLVDAQVAPPCADKILPCMDYLNSTNPPDICCNPVKDVFDATQEACFCQLAIPGLLEGFGVKLSQALAVLHACGVNFDVNSCKASSPALSPSLVQQPPATPGSDEGGAATTVLIKLYFIPFIWVSMCFY